MSICFYLMHSHGLKQYDRKLTDTCNHYKNRLGEYQESVISYFRNTPLEDIVKNFSSIRMSKHINIREVEHDKPTLKRKDRLIYPHIETFRTINVGSFNVTAVFNNDHDMSSIYSIEIPIKNITINNMLHYDLYDIWKTLYEKFGKHVHININKYAVTFYNPEFEEHVHLSQHLLKSAMKSDFCEWIFNNVLMQEIYKTAATSMGEVKCHRNEENKIYAMEHVFKGDSFDEVNEKLDSLGWENLTDMKYQGWRHAIKQKNDLNCSIIQSGLTSEVKVIIYNKHE